MKVKALALTGATVGVAVVTLVGLNLAAPITHAEEGLVALVPADSVFAASIAEPGEGAATGDLEIAQAETAAPQQAAAPAAYSAPATTAAPEVGEPASGDPAIDSEPYAAMAEFEPLADDSQPVLAGGACSTGRVDRPQAASGQPDAAGAAPASGVAGVGEIPADTAPAPVAVRKVAPAPVKDKPKAAVKKAPRVQPPETRLAWWPAAKDGKLNLTYAGSASFTKAIALIFDGTHADGSKANAHIKVTTKDGRSVPGQWLVAKGNSRMLLYSVPPGIYRVSVDAGMSDQGERVVAAASSGMVFVP